MEKDKDEVRQRILAAAKELFVQQGYKKTTIRQIVEKSGVLTGSIYYFSRIKKISSSPWSWSCCGSAPI